MPMWKGYGKKLKKRFAGARKAYDNAQKAKLKRLKTRSAIAKQKYEISSYRAAAKLEKAKAEEARLSVARSRETSSPGISLDRVKPPSWEGKP